MQQDNAPLEKASAQASCWCAAPAVWTDVISSKKALLEEAFKKPTVCELNAARALLANVAGQHWHQFVDSQLSGTYQNHTISRTCSDSNQVIHMWLRVHVSLVKELVVAQATRYHEWHAHAKKWALH
ncbi:hypothetical protein COOONC_24436, partial [Cooperia oncophora]